MISYVVMLTALFLNDPKPLRVDFDHDLITSKSGCGNIFPPLDTLIEAHSEFARKHFPERIKMFMKSGLNEGDVVLVGNSLTEKGSNWDARLEIVNSKNRGISGDNTFGVLARLKELICKKPSVVFLMIGTNDLFSSSGPEEIYRRIDLIGSILSTELPESRIMVQTIMPLGVGHERKSKLIAINNLLLETKQRKYELLDTYCHMTNQNGDLPEKFTDDQVHLTEEGYSHWSTLLRRTINNNR